MNYPSGTTPDTSPRSLHRPSTARPSSARKPREKNKKQNEQAAQLAQQLMILRDTYTAPIFNDFLTTAIDAAQRIAKSTRRSDRDAVFHAIFEQGSREMDEICDDTLLTRRVVQPILDEFHSAGLIEIKEKYQLPRDRKEGGRPELQYHPVHKLP